MRTTMHFPWYEVVKGQRGCALAK